MPFQNFYCRCSYSLNTIYSWGCIFFVDFLYAFDVFHAFHAISIAICERRTELAGAEHFFYGTKWTVTNEDRKVSFSDFFFSVNKFPHCEMGRKSGQNEISHVFFLFISDPFLLAIPAISYCFMRDLS